MEGETDQRIEVILCQCTSMDPLTNRSYRAAVSRLELRIDVGDGDGALRFVRRARSVVSQGADAIGTVICNIVVIAQDGVFTLPQGCQTRCAHLMCSFAIMAAPSKAAHDRSMRD